jgi:DNA-binding NarL/FixJ family response regulator
MKPLTKRQIEFLSMTASGMTNEEIAKVCCVAKSTVVDAFSEARKRLGTRTTAQTVLLAISREELGLDHNGRCFIPSETEFLQL